MEEKNNPTAPSSPGRRGSIRDDPASPKKVKADLEQVGAKPPPGRISKKKVKKKSFSKSKQAQMFEQFTNSTGLTIE